MTKQQQQPNMVDPVTPEPPINKNVWSKKDIKMMVEEEDLHSRKRSNENYAYLNKLK